MLLYGNMVVVFFITLLLLLLCLRSHSKQAGKTAFLFVLYQNFHDENISTHWLTVFLWKQTLAHIICDNKCLTHSNLRCYDAKVGMLLSENSKGVWCLVHKEPNTELTTDNKEDETKEAFIALLYHPGETRMRSCISEFEFGVFFCYFYFVDLQDSLPTRLLINTK